VLPPVGPIDILGMKEGVTGVGHEGRRRRDAEIFPEGNYEDALSALRNAEVRSVENLAVDFIGELVRAINADLDSVDQLGIVCPPVLTTGGLTLRQFELAEDVVEVRLDGISHKPADVLDEDGLRSELASGSEHLREHVPVIEFPLVLSTEREWLAGSTRGKKIDLALVWLVVDLGDIVRDNDGPVADLRKVFAVLPKRGEGVLIDLDEQVVLEPSSGYAEREAPGAREEFN